MLSVVWSSSSTASATEARICDVVVATEARICGSAEEGGSKMEEAWVGGAVGNEECSN